MGFFSLAPIFKSEFRNYQKIPEFMPYCFAGIDLDHMKV